MSSLRKNKDEVVVLIDGLQKQYAKLFEPQLAMHHQVPRNRIRAWKEWDLDNLKWTYNEEERPQPGEAHRDVLGIGSLASGKTHEFFYKILISLLYIPNNYGCVVRKRWEEIENHLIKDFLAFCNDMFKGEENRLKIVSDEKTVGASKVITVNTPYFNEETGARVTSEVVFKPEPDKNADELEEHWKGPEYGFVAFDEGKELKEVTHTTLCGRLRRKFYKLFTKALFLQENPKASEIDDDIHFDIAYDEWVQRKSSYLHWSLLITNPPYYGHWIDIVSRESEEMAKLNKLTTDDILVVRSKMDDNIWTPESYKRRQKRLYRNDPQKWNMLIEGKNGILVNGVGVYSAHFSPEWHIDDELEFHPFKDLIVGLDFGYTRPAAVFIQEIEDRFQVLAELCPTQIDAEEFADLILRQLAYNFRGHKGEVFYYGDVAGNQKSDKGPTTIERFRDKGLNVFSQKLALDDSIDVVRAQFNRLVGRPPRPRLIIKGSTCPILTLALSGGYYYRVSGGQQDPRPFKTSDNHMDDVCDALRYAIANVVSSDGTSKAAGLKRWLDEDGNIVQMQGMGIDEPDVTQWEKFWHASRN